MDEGNTKAKQEEVKLKLARLRSTKDDIEEREAKAINSLDMIFPSLVTLTKTKMPLSSKFPLDALQKNLQEILLVRVLWYEAGIKYFDTLYGDLEHAQPQNAGDEIEITLLKTLADSNRSTLESQCKDINLLAVLAVLMMGAYRQLMDVSTLKSDMSSFAPVVKRLARLMKTTKKKGKKGKVAEGEATALVESMYADLVKRGVIV